MYSYNKIPTSSLPICSGVKVMPKSEGMAVLCSCRRRGICQFLQAAMLLRYTSMKHVKTRSKNLNTRHYFLEAVSPMSALIHGLWTQSHRYTEKHVHRRNTILKNAATSLMNLWLKGISLLNYNLFGSTTLISQAGTPWPAPKYVKTSTKSKHKYQSLT